MGKAAWASG